MSTDVRKRLYDLHAVQHATSFSGQMIASVKREAERMSQDLEKDEREKALQCLYCYYRRGRGAGQMLTTWACARCNKEQCHGDTAVPALCDYCAKETGLCVTCLAHRDGTMVRTLL